MACCDAFVLFYFSQKFNEPRTTGHESGSRRERAKQTTARISATKLRIPADCLPGPGTICVSQLRKMKYQIEVGIGLSSWRLQL